MNTASTSSGAVSNILHVEVQNAVPSDLLVDAACIPSDTQLTKWAECAHALGSELPSDLPVELGIRIVTVDEMKQLNGEFRDKAHPTNVLSFPMQLDAAIAADLGSQPLGDIAICHAVVEDEARSQNKSLDSHYAHMVVHGVLHLLGFDHQDDAEAELMERTESAILEQCGFDNPYC